VVITFNNNTDVVYRHEDLKQMLDSNKDSLKLEAMKRIIGVSSECKCFCVIIMHFFTIKMLIHNVELFLKSN
jgi:hypothetical protein